MSICLITVLLFQSMTAAQPESKSEPRVQTESPAHSSFDDPFFKDSGVETIQRMREQMLKNFDRFSGFGGFDDSFFEGGRSSGFFGSASKPYTLETRETDESVIYEVHLQQNVEGETVDVSVDRGMVTISGKTIKKSQNGSDDEPAFFSASSTFSQSFSVPDYVDSDNVDIINEQKKIILKFPKHSREV